MGVDWRSSNDFGSFMELANIVGIIDTDGIYLVKRGTREIKPFPEKYLQER